MSVFEPHDVVWTAEKVRRFWDHQSQSEATYFAAQAGPTIASLVSRFVRPERGVVLDAGCGIGILLELLVARGFSVAGVDSSPEAVARTRERLGAIAPDLLKVGDLTAIPFADGFAHAIVLTETLEHVLEADIARIFSELRRVLEPGGLLLLTTPNSEDISAAHLLCPDCGARFHPMQHVTSWTAESIASLLRAHGFEPRAVTTLRFPHRGGPVERRLRSFWYRMKRDERNLFVVAASR